MTVAPPDLLATRAQLQTVTGLGPTDLGIVGDGAHQRTGGYHEGKGVLISIGRYHPPASAHVGSSAEDYSARLLRDREGLTENASALDIGADWPHGGRAAWLRFNNLLVQLLPTDPTLAAVRAINYSPDGTSKKRMDRQAGWAAVPSTDTVTTHTHVEFYRDLDGRRGPTLVRIVQLAQQAITGQEDDMEQGEKLQRKTDFDGRTLNDVWADTENFIRWGYALPGATGLVNPPPAGSAFDLLIKAAQNPGDVTQDMLNTAMKLALSDPSVVAALVKQINDDAADRMAQ